MRKKTSTSTIWAAPGASLSLAVWTPINTLPAGPMQGRTADPGTKGPTLLYLMGSSSAGSRNKEIPKCSGCDYLGPATASPFFASRGASIVFKTSCYFLFAKAERCGNGTWGGGQGLGRVWWVEPTSWLTQLWDLNPVSPELLWSLVAVVTAMAALPRDWNGELGHNYILWGNSHWGLRLGVGTWMGAGNAGGGRWLAGEHWGLGSKLWSHLSQVRKHLDSTAGLRVLPGRQEIENCDYPLQESMLSLSKGSSPCLLLAFFPTSPTPAYSSPHWPATSTKVHGPWGGPRAQSGLRCKRRKFLPVAALEGAPHPSFLLLWWGVGHQHSSCSLLQPLWFRNFHGYQTPEHHAKPSSLTELGLGHRNRTRTTEQLHSKSKFHRHAVFSSQLPPPQLPPSVPTQRVGALLIETLPWMLVAQLLVQSLAHVWDLPSAILWDGWMDNMHWYCLYCTICSQSHKTKFVTSSCPVPGTPGTLAPTNLH